MKYCVNVPLERSYNYRARHDLLNTTYNFLGLTAKGRDQNPDHPQDWVLFHDKYKKASASCCY